MLILICHKDRKARVMHNRTWEDWDTAKIKIIISEQIFKSISGWQVAHSSLTYALCCEEDSCKSQAMPT